MSKESVYHKLERQLAELEAILDGKDVMAYTHSQISGHISYASSGPIPSQAYVPGLPYGLGGTPVVDSDGTPDPPVPKPKPKTTVDFDSVILPKSKKQEILDAISQVENNDLIFNIWGFSEKFEKGTAISMLFYGVPGTGKTLMGQAIADKFGYKLKIISTAEIESSEPGQAERNLKAYFEGKSNQVLLFDECDSLIAPRNEVGMILGAQINALLTGLEQFKGIAIFTTNRLGRLDPAFERRLSLKMEFEMPTKKQRIEIWKRMFPKKAPLAKDINWDAIAGIEIAGGHIKNVVLRAARMAANMKGAKSRKKITNDILIEALTKEVTSMLDFHEAAKTTPSIPRMGGGDMGYSRTSTMNKTIGKGGL